MDIKKKNTQQEALQSKKKVWIMIIIGLFLLILLNLSVSASFRNSLDTNLKSYYPLNNSMSDFGIDGVAITDDGTANTSGKIGDARDFVPADTDALTRVATGLTGSQVRSFNVWIWTDENANYRDILTYGTEATNQLFHWRQQNTGKLWFQNQGVAIESNGSVLSTGQWYMATFTYDGTSIRLYQNAVLVAEQAMTMNTGTVYGLRFGGYVDGIQDPWDGRMDEIGIWNKTLNQSEVTQLYNSGNAFTYFQPTLSVSLVSPVNDFNSTSSTMNFSASITGTAILNVTINVTYYNGTEAYTNTNTSGVLGTYNWNNIPLGINDYNWTVYAYDSLGEKISASNGKFIFHTKKALFINLTYESSILEQTQTILSTEVTLNPSYFISSVTLKYGGTDYPATFSAINSTTYRAAVTLTTPSIAANTNKTFNWTTTLTDATTFTSNSFIQTILNFGVDDCSVNTIQIMNLSLKDEQDQTNLTTADNMSINVDLRFYPSPTLSGDYIPFYSNYTNINPARVCVSAALGNAIFYLNAQIQYGADNYATEYYNIRNYSLNASANPSENITLYDLNNNSNQVFTIKYRDENFLPVGEALIQISRKYVNEGVFKTVEIPITDDSGTTAANLQLNTVIYTFTITKNGRLLAVFNNYLAQCQNPLITKCEIDLNSFQSSIPLTNYTISNDFLYTLTYNNNTRTITAAFTIPSGAVSTVSLNVTKSDALGSQICSDIVTTSSGSLDCIVASNFGNATVMAYLYKDGTLIAYGQINLQQKPQQIYGGTLVFLALLIILTLLGASVSDNPIMMIIAFLIGIFLLIALNFISGTVVGGGATVLFLVIAIIIVLIKASRRS